MEDDQRVGDQKSISPFRPGLLHRRLPIAVSPVLLNNLQIMNICTKYDQRQRIGEPYALPDADVRRLKASILLEETLETIRALGFRVCIDTPGCFIDTVTDVVLYETFVPNLLAAIDGAGDTAYVAISIFAACGVPDIPHMEAICAANLAKFPGGVAIIRPEDGKYLKPEGWQPPDHQGLADSLRGKVDLKELAGGGT